MKVILIRHGETDYNVESRLIGWRKIPLNQTGIQQVSLLAEILDKHYSISKIYSSDLLRTKQTAEIINEKLNIKEIHFKSKLREQSLGDWEGLLLEDLKKKDSFMRFLKLNDEEESVPNGEPIQVFNDRVFFEFRLIIEQNLLTNNEILIVAHEGTNRIILGNLLGLSFSDSQKILKQSNACINEIKFEKTFDDYKINNINVTSFLL